MRFIVSLLFMLLPIVLYVMISSNKDESFRSYVKKRKNSIPLFIFVLIVFSMPLIINSNDTYHHLIDRSPSYKDLEALNYALIIDLVLALVFAFAIRKKGHRHKLDNKRIVLTLLITVITLIEAFSSFSYAFYANKNLIISEVCRKEITEYLIQDVEYKDEKSYITIYNPNEYACYVETLYISTDEDYLKEHKFFNVEIPAKQTYTIYFEYGDLDISKSKNSDIFLGCSRYEEYIDYVSSPALENDSAYSLDVETNTWDIIQTYPNKLPSSVTIETPTFDHESGFYDSAFDLYIDVPEGTTVYYTTDSSNPSVDSFKYDGTPIHIYDKSSEENSYRSISNISPNYLIKNLAIYKPVEKCFILRAVAIDNDGNSSDIVTNSYFINKEKYANQRVISLVSDPDNLFGDENGIYVTGKDYDYWYSSLSDEDKNSLILGGKLPAGEDEEGNILYADSPTPNYLVKGRISEREANFELFEAGSVYLEQNVGIRIQGNSSRWGRNKRFSVYSRSEYSGSKWFDKELFEGVSTHSIVLREGYINAFSHYLCSDRDVGTQNSIPVVLFLDGEYWYTTYILDKYSEANISLKYNLTVENIAIAENGAETTSVNSYSNSFEKLKAFYKGNDLSIQENYDELNTMMDIQSYIDFTCINVYLANMDYGEGKNIQQFHTIVKENDEFGDGRWRWTLYDMDLLTSSSLENQEGIKYDYEIDSFSTKGKYVGGSSINEQPLYVALKANDNFCKDFVLTFMDLVNTTFTVSNVKEKMSEFGGDISWNNSFFINRKDYILPYLEKEFELSGTLETVYLNTNNPDAGIIKLNTITPSLNNEWSGEYYTDYPLTVSVYENKGYTFDHWEVNGEFYSNDLNISVNVTKGGLRINAVFK